MPSINIPQNTKVHNNAIDIFRFVAAVLVVSHHTDALAEIHPMLSYLVSQVIPRVSVPFFFAVAGYYYSAKLESGHGGYWDYIKRLLRTYTVWSVIYFVGDYLLNGGFDIKKVLLDYFIFGSAYHFWFFPALILSVSVFTAMHKLRLHKLLIPVSLVLYLIGCLSHVYYRIGGEIPFVKALVQLPDWRWISHVFTLGFPSFILGYVLYLTRNQSTSVKHTRRKDILAGFMLVVFLGEILILKVFDWARTTAQSVGLYLFTYAILDCLLNHPMPQCEKVGRTCRVLANVTFYSHVLFIFIFNEMNTTIFAERLTYTVKFLFVFLLSLILGVLLRLGKGKFVKALYT